MSMTEKEEAVAAFQGLLDAEQVDEEQAPSEELTDDLGSQPEDDADEAEVETSDEDEAEAETDEQEDDDTDDEEPAGAQSIEVTFDDGQTQRLTPEEVKAGYLRESDYRVKTHELGNQRRALDEARQSFETERQRAITDFNEQLKVLQEFREPEPEWDSDDPIGSIERQRVWKARDQQIDAKLREHYQSLQKQQGEIQQQRAEHQRAQAELLPQIIPEWRNPDVANQEMGEMRTFLEQEGFTLQEISEVNDARLVKVLRMAFKGQQSAKAKKTVVEKKTTAKPKVQKPGTTKPKNQKQVAARQSTNKARQSNNLRDWGKAFQDNGFV